MVVSLFIALVYISSHVYKKEQSTYIYCLEMHWSRLLEALKGMSTKLILYCAKLIT